MLEEVSGEVREDMKLGTRDWDDDCRLFVVKEKI